MNSRAPIAVKERGIIFSAPMVKAILDGRKTQTRRIVKPQPVGGDTIHKRGMDDGWMVGQMRDSENAWRTLRCPHGKPGDRLWVKESFAVKDEDTTFYKAGSFRPLNAVPAPDATDSIKWMSPRYMPRLRSRITLEVTGVRVERVQEISARDCLAEGIEIPMKPVPAGMSAREAIEVLDAEPQAIKAREWAGGFDAGHCQLVRVHFSELWTRINGAGSWEANRWVWVVEFRRIKP